MKTKIGVAGACGRMGRGIIKALRLEGDMELVLAVDLIKIGMDCGEALDIGNIGVEINSPEDLEKVIEKTKAQVLVDFTNPKATVRNVKTAAMKGINLVIGTTGLGKEDLEKIKRSIKENRVSAVISPNMATGVNLFFKLVEDAALGLGKDFDVEIIEAHHSLKKDAPSGTALKAGELIAKALGREVSRDGVFGRRGLVGERQRGEIGFHAVRAGDIVGDHTVLFAGRGERIEVTHRANSRDAFVDGVIKAIRFIGNKGGDGRVYSTWDVLGIK
jgi:4-hydroxy-tetrahydrodipicolinate reductase